MARNRSEKVDVPAGISAKLEAFMRAEALEGSAGACDERRKVFREDAVFSVEYLNLDPDIRNRFRAAVRAAAGLRPRGMGIASAALL